jgi:hypothetical protein
LIFCKIVPTVLLTSTSPDELEIVDLHAGKRGGYHTNWAVVYRGDIIKDRFATDAVAMLWIRSQLVDGLSEHDAIADLWAETGQKSWAIH